MRVAHSFLLLLAALLTGFACRTKKPGLKAVITDRGLQYVCKTGLPILKNELMSIGVPDLSDIGSAPIVGKLDYTLSKVNLSNISIPNCICASGSKGVTVNASGISFSGSANWHYRRHKWPYISDSGDFKLNLTNTSLSVTIVVGKDSRGHATLNTTGCSISVGPLNVVFGGGASWLYNLFERSIIGSMTNSLNKELCKEFTKLIRTEGNKTLDTFPVIIPVYKDVEIDFSLLRNPLFTPAYVEVFLKGEFLSASNPNEVSFCPPHLPLVYPSIGDKMAYFWLTDYIANTAGLAFLSAGVLDYTITSDIIPKTVPFPFTTAFFEASLPQLYNEFPDMDIKLAVHATEAPVLHIVPDSADFNLTGRVNLIVVQPNKTDFPAFVLEGTLYADAEIYLNSTGPKTLIAANATLIKVDMDLVSSNIGPFNVTDLQDNINDLALAFMPTFNYFLNTGFPIPAVEGVSFSNSTLELGKNFALVKTDFKYQ